MMKNIIRNNMVAWGIHIAICILAIVVFYVFTVWHLEGYSLVFGLVFKGLLYIVSSAFLLRKCNNFWRDIASVMSVSICLVGGLLIHYFLISMNILTTMDMGFSIILCFSFVELLNGSTVWHCFTPIILSVLMYIGIVIRYFVGSDE